MQPPPRIYPSVQLRSFSTALAIFAASFFAGSGAKAEPSAAALAELASETCVLSGGTRADVEAIATAKGWRKSDGPASNAQDPLEASWEVVILPGTLTTVRVGQSILNEDIVDVCTVVVEAGQIPFAALQPELTRRLPLKRETPPGPDGWSKIFEFYSLQPSDSAPGAIATQLARPAHLLVHFNPSGIVHSIQISAAARAPAIAADVAPLAEAIHELCVKTGGTASAMRFAADVKGWQLILDGQFVTRWRKSAQTPAGGHAFTVERSNSASPNCSVRSLTPRFTHDELVSALQKLVNLEQEQDEKNGLRRWQLFGIAPSVPPTTLPAGASRYTLGVYSNHYGVVLNVRFWAR